MNDLRILSIKEPWLRELILEKSKSEHFVELYKLTQDQILQYLDELVDRGLAWFYGSESERFVYRVSQPNPYVAEPHYLGCMKKLRTLQPLAIKWVFENTDIQKINIYTTLKSSIRIQQRYGYEVEGILTKTFLEDGELKDLHGFTSTGKPSSERKISRLWDFRKQAKRRGYVVAVVSITFAPRTSGESIYYESEIEIYRKIGRETSQHLPGRSSSWGAKTY